MPYVIAFCCMLTWFSDLLLTNRIWGKWWNVTSEISLQKTVNFHLAGSLSPSLSLTLLTCSLWRSQLPCFNLPRTLTLPLLPSHHPAVTRWPSSIQRRILEEKKLMNGVFKPVYEVQGRLLSDPHVKLNRINMANIWELNYSVEYHAAFQIGLWLHTNEADQNSTQTLWKWNHVWNDSPQN